MDASNFLTEGRVKLLEALQADTELNDRIVTWYDWGPGLQKRYMLEPAQCPLLSVVPAELSDEELSNITDRFPQDVEVGIATDGQDANPCEYLVSRALGVLATARESRLGLASDGLAAVTLLNARWQSEPFREGPRILWLAVLNVRLAWYLRNYS